jgi:multidrug efflux system membrane fusion protein
MFSILTALLVVVALFYAVLERDALLRLAGRLTGGEAAETAPVAAPESPVAIAEAEAAEGEAPVGVRVLRSDAKEVADAVLVRGQSEAARQVVVRAETSGTVVSEPLRKGAFVEAGQVLCELDPGSRGADLIEAEARLAEARSRLPEAEAGIPEAEARVAEAEARLQEALIIQNAASRLSEGGFASDTQVASSAVALRSAEAGVTSARTGLETNKAELESARAGIQSAEAAVERARVEMEKLTVRAPFAGLLETDTAELGALLDMGEADCATVLQLDPMRIVGFLPEAQVDRIEVGARAGARLASGLETTGRVTFLSRSADEMTRTFRVEVTVENDDLTIRDGQTAEMLVETAPTVAHLVPASALTLDDEGRLGLRVVEEGRAAFAPVELIRDTVEGVLLTGLPERVDIIVTGQEYVTDGVAVRADYVGGAPAPRAEATQ